MNQVEYTDLTPALVAQLRTKSRPGAPWANAPEAFWNFLLSSLELNVPWTVESTLAKAWVEPAKPLSKAVQDNVSWQVQYGQRAGFDYGIGLEERKYLGGMTGTGFTGEGENNYSASYEQDPQFVELGKVMTIFWPDLPFLAWEQIKPLVSARSRDTVNDYYEATSDYEVDRLDAAKVFRVLSHAGRLEPTQQRFEDWKTIISPPPAPSAPARKPRA